MQITDLQEEQKTPPVWRLGFRPFFLFGSAFSLIAITIWTLQYTGIAQIKTYGGGYWWHIHEMIFGFVIAIVAGFLLTAVQNWTGQRGLHGKTLMALFFTWLLARIALFMPDIIPSSIIVLIDISFLPLTAYLLAKPIIKIKQYRNLFFVPLLVVFTLLNALFHYYVHEPSLLMLPQLGYAAVLLVTFLMSVMAGRVTPMFTANGTKTQKATPLPILDILANGSILLTAIVMIVDSFTAVSSSLLASLFVIAGLTQTVRWLRWKPWITYSVPLLWSLHGAIKIMAFSLLILGLCYFDHTLPKIHFWHLLTIGAMAGLILAMISRVSLGHTGRTLSPPKIMSFAFSMIFFAALIRSFGAWLYPAYTLEMIMTSASAWVIAFGLFVIFYGPMLLSARVDGRPG